MTRINSSTASRENFSGIALTLPSSFLLLVLYILPMLALLALSFTSYELGDVQIQWVGWKNYFHALQDPVFHRSLSNTFMYMVYVIPTSVLGGLLIALLIHSRKISRPFYEVMYFLPVTSTLIAMATVWQFLLHPKLGPVNTLLKYFGLNTQNFLGDPSLMMPTIAAIGIWQLLGFNMILFLTGLSSIPRSLYEAASIDGITSDMDCFFKITWPMLGPTTLFVVVTSTITTFKIFDTVAVLTQGRDKSEVLLYDIYLEGFTYANMGYAAVLTILFLLLIVGFTAWQSLHMDKKVHYT